MIFVATLAIAVLAAATANKDCFGCGPEWEYYDGKCYYAYQYAKYTYHQSKAICEGKGGQLVTIDSANENLFLYGYARDTYQLWIGANDQTVEGTFNWQGETSLSFTNWDSNEPNDYKGNEDCAMMRKSGKWNDVICSSKEGFICEKSPGVVAVPPIHCDDGWHLFNDHCYHASDRKTYTYTAARYACAKSGGHLVTIENSKEEEFVRGQTNQKDGYWIGLNDRKSEGQWQWEDNSPVGYTKWGKNEPNNYNNEDCAHINSKGDWNDNSCSRKFGYICEKE